MYAYMFANKPCTCLNLRFWLLRGMWMDLKSTGVNKKMTYPVYGNKILIRTNLSSQPKTNTWKCNPGSS